MSTDQVATARSAFTTSAPDISLFDIETLLRERYGLEAKASMLTSERDLTVRVTTETGEAYVLKIANAAEDPAVTAFQNRAIEHIERIAPDVPASRLVPTLNGETEFFVERSGERHFTRLLTWLPGQPLFGMPQTRAQMRSIGTALGRLANALERFDHPASGHEIVWDLKHSSKLMPLTHHIHDADLRAKVDTIFSRFHAEILPRQNDLRRQVVHNDFNPFNLLVDPVDTDRISGILDFGDLVSTPTIYDLAVACAYQVPDEGEPLAFVSELLGAYHAIQPVPPDELELLFDLIATRHAMTITVAEWRANRYPENAPYILRNHARAKTAIGRCAEMTREAASAILRGACGYPA